MGSCLAASAQGQGRVEQTCLPISRSSCRKDAKAALGTFQESWFLTSGEKLTRMSACSSVVVGFSKIKGQEGRKQYLLNIYCMLGSFIDYLLIPCNSPKGLWAQLQPCRTAGSGPLSQCILEVGLLPQWFWKAENRAHEDFPQALRSDEVLPCSLEFFFFFNGNIYPMPVSSLCFGGT